MMTDLLIASYLLTDLIGGLEGQRRSSPGIPPQTIQTRPE